jgi:phage/plasmid-like protein (TIGR03299 family)
MAHNLMTGRNGKAAMMYTGETPWHGLGHAVADAQSAADAIRLAQLGWTVEPREIYMLEGDGLKMIPGRRAITRTDTGKVFAVMSDSFTPVQNHEGFAFMDSLTRDGALKYNTAGALGDGERVWMLAELPGEMRIEGTDDVSQKFLLLANGHDGSLAFHVKATAVRVVCQNTLTAALGTGWRKRAGGDGGDGGRGIALRHTSNVLNQAETVRKALGLAVRQFDALNQDSNELAAAPCAPDALRAYVAKLIPDNPEAEKSTRTDKIRETIVGNFAGSPGNDMPGIKGSWWAALNAVTYYTDHQRASRGESDLDKRSNRLESAWFGTSAELKDTAMDLALESAGIVPALSAGI